jgi:glycosyltransferase involved in cell wall biosynthesis
MESAIPTVITIHDLIHRAHGGLLRRAYYDHCIKPLARKASSILTVSRYSRDLIRDWLDDDSVDVRVVGNGVSSVFHPNGPALILGAPYLLYVGNYRAHKNIERMLRAFASARLDKAVLLVLAGEAHSSVVELARRLGISHRVRFLGGISEEGLAAAYRGALCVLQVSLVEGFGLAVIEGMACGTPVICSETTSLGEIGCDAALLVDPESVENMTVAIESLQTNTDLLSTMREKGIERARNFKWETVTLRTLDAIREAAIQ